MRTATVAYARLSGVSGGVVCPGFHNREVAGSSVAPATRHLRSRADNPIRK